MSQVSEKDTKATAGAGKTKASSGDDKAHSEKSLLTMHLSDDYDDIGEMLAGHPQAEWKFGLFREEDPPVRVFPGGHVWEPATLDDLDARTRRYARNVQVASLGQAVKIAGDVLWKVPMKAWIAGKKKTRDLAYFNMDELISKEIIADETKMRKIIMDGDKKPDA